jgi:hypothetical protein
MVSTLLRVFLGLKDCLWVCRAGAAIGIKYNKNICSSRAAASLLGSLLAVQTVLLALLAAERSGLNEFFADFCEHLLDALATLGGDEIGGEADGVSEEADVPFLDLFGHVALVAHEADHDVGVGVVLGLLDPVVLDFFEGGGVGEVVDDEDNLRA